MSIYKSIISATRKKPYSDKSIQRWAKRDIEKYGSVEAALREARSENNLQLIEYLEK